jgi:hypothetical protein
MFKDHANPVGAAKRVNEIETRLNFYRSLWDSQNNKRSFWSPKISLSRVTNFLMVALDDFVVTAATVVIAGPDKKATVLDAVDRLYDYTVREAMPIWMRPIATPVKQYIIYVLVSNAIDWMVAKYKNGSWKDTETKLERTLAVLPSVTSCRRARRGK